MLSKWLLKHQEEDIKLEKVSINGHWGCVHFGGVPRGHGQTSRYAQVTRHAVIFYDRCLDGKVSSRRIDRTRDHVK